MALVNTGTQRSMTMSIEKRGNDNSFTIMSPTSNPAHPKLDGKNAFGSFALITEAEMQALSDADFTARVNAWKAYIQTEYATSDPDMWDDISGSFTYTNGLVLRLYFDAATGTVKTTIFGGTSTQPIYSKIIDSTGNTIHSFDIYPGSPVSTTGYGGPGGPGDMQNIKDNDRFVMITSEFIGGKHVSKYVQVQGDTTYPLPI